MSDIIHLLPDSIANQIAAGEVIQRPASVVKELVENSLDAGAKHIRIVIKDAGRTLIQVIDDGKGMSATDARMAFERHATSKIKTADDLFALHTRGFRGEALASVAAIAHVELKTRRAEDEVGTLLKIAGSKVESQQTISGAVGTTISVKNIFFNVPARRKFLKSNETERRNIFTEIERIALVNPDTEFTLIENDVQTLQLPAANLRKRIVQLQGKAINQQLIEINEQTTLAKIHGYISTPQFARKGRANQFFFANNRYIRHPYFHKAVMTAYEPLISASENPNYFIYFEVEPDAIDVNIHPTKTEVKFEDERTLWQILMVTVKESLGKFNAIPSIDFDTADAPDIPIFDPSKSTSMPKVSINPNYNPFQTSSGGGFKPSKPKLDWEQLYKGFENEEKLPSVSPDTDTNLFQTSHSLQGDSVVLSSPEHYQYKQKYILTSVKSGLMIIDQHRAHVRILFDKYLSQITNRKGVSQRVLFPEMIQLTSAEASSLTEIAEDMEALGFELSDLGNNAFAIQGIPSELQNVDAVALIHSLIDKNMETGSNIQEQVHESLALSMANFTAIPAGKSLSEEEMLLMVNQLFACQLPNHTPDGKSIITVISDDEIEKKLKG
ncbi:DNA mismatch repair endonuclease MutL [Petrimonas sp.]|uniref:DNA mismatch repair endonuclease MutL n=1 Tax=Petrimonas sp. TaxID=2023866 RepID=UPI003F5136AA